MSLLYACSFLKLQVRLPLPALQFASCIDLALASIEEQEKRWLLQNNRSFNLMAKATGGVPRIVQYILESKRGELE